MSFESDGLTTVVDHDSLSHLDGLQLDAWRGGFLFPGTPMRRIAAAVGTFSE